MDKTGLKRVLAALVLALSASLPLSIAAANISLAALTAALLAYAARGGELPWRAILKDPVAAAIGAYLACALLSAGLGVNPARSLAYFPKDLHKLWVFAVLSLALRAAPNPGALIALGAAFSAAAALGIAQSLASLSGPVWLRARGFVHPVTYGEQMALAVLGGIFLSRAPWIQGARRWIQGALALACAALLCNQSWGALLGAGAGAAAVALARRPGLKPVLAAAAGLALALALFELLPTGRSLSAGVAALSAGSWEGPFQRLILWKVAWLAFLDHPLTGVGPGNYREVFGAYHGGLIEGEAAFGSAHNLYLHQLAERGLVGLAALLAVLGALLARAWRRLREIDDFPNRWALAAVAALLAMSLTEEVFQNELVMTLTLFIWSWAEGLSRKGSGPV